MVSARNLAQETGSSGARVCTETDRPLSLFLTCFSYKPSSFPAGSQSEKEYPKE